MDVTKYRVLQLGLLLVQFIFSISVVGAYTGWFKNGPDLVKTLLLIGHFVLVAAIVLPANFYLFLSYKKGDSSLLALKVCFVATALCLIVTLGCNRYLFGGTYPRFGGIVSKSFTHEFVDSNGHIIEYWVELENPFHSSHSERLILKEEEETREIDMVLKKNEMESIFRGPNDIALTQEGSRILLESQLAVDTRYVVIDYESGTVLSNWIKGASSPRGAEGSSGSEEINP